MNYPHFVGIDVSKESLDITVLNQEGIIEEQLRISNTSSGLKSFLKQQARKSPEAFKQILFCLEPTGHYSNMAIALLVGMKLFVWAANPLDIKNSIGMQRGKNDKIDAERIARYAHRFHDKARLAQPNEADRMQLQQLLTQREMLIKDKGKYSAQLHDYKDRIGKEAYAAIRTVNRGIIRQLEKFIELIEQKLETMITSIPEMKNQYELLKTIPGVGKVVSQTLVIFTNGFTRFDNARALSCHAGIAPFEYKSGSSIRSKNRVSHRSNKRLKTLLHMAALAAVKTNGELKIYYERKTAEGKNKMSVLNAVRNKILHRVFAVLKRNTEYKLVMS